MTALKIRRVGDSLGVILPKEALDRLHVGEGETLYLSEAPDGLRLTVSDPELDSQMDAFRRVNKKWRPLLRRLAT